MSFKFDIMSDIFDGFLTSQVYNVDVSLNDILTTQVCNVAVRLNDILTAQVYNVAAVVRLNDILTYDSVII